MMPDIPNIPKTLGEQKPFMRRSRRNMTQIARKLRHNQTPTEKMVWEVVRRKQIEGLRFLGQHDIGHFVLDFYCAVLNLALEIDGGIHALPEVERYDRDREMLLLEESGVRFIRFSNDQVLKWSREELQEAIRQLIKS
jgi:very-short-patch-repair endonuclease